MTDSESVTGSVAEVDSSPALGPIGDKTAPEYVELSFVAIATDPDLPAQSIAYALGPGAPTGASIDPSSGVFTWTPSEAQGPGTYPVEVVACRATPAAPACETISITVAEVDTPPGSNRSETSQGLKTTRSPSSQRHPMPTFLPNTHLQPDCAADRRDHRLDERSVQLDTDRSPIAGHLPGRGRRDRHHQ